MFVGSSDKVYIIDKAEANPTQINGHSVWAAVWCVVHVPSFPLSVPSKFGTGTSPRAPQRRWMYGQTPSVRLACTFPMRLSPSLAGTGPSDPMAIAVILVQRRRSTQHTKITMAQKRFVSSHHVTVTLINLLVLGMINQMVSKCSSSAGIPPQKPWPTEQSY